MKSLYRLGLNVWVFSYRPEGIRTAHACSDGNNLVNVSSGSSSVTINRLFNLSDVIS